MSTHSYESVTRGCIGTFLIRVWRTEPMMPTPLNNTVLKEHIAALHDKTMFEPDFKITAYDIIDDLAKFDRVAAVEAYDSATQETLLVYVDWPA